MMFSSSAEFFLQKFLSGILAKKHLSVKQLGSILSGPTFFRAYNLGTNCLQRLSEQMTEDATSKGRV